MMEAGWEQKTTSGGQTYYVNHITKITSWERPVGSPVGGASPSVIPSASSNGSSQPEREKLCMYGSILYKNIFAISDVEILPFLCVVIGHDLLLQRTVGNHS